MIRAELIYFLKRGGRLIRAELIYLLKFSAKKSLKKFEGDYKSRRNLPPEFFGKKISLKKFEGDK